MYLALLDGHQSPTSETLLKYNNFIGSENKVKFGKFTKFGYEAYYVGYT